MEIGKPRRKLEDVPLMRDMEEALRAKPGNRFEVWVMGRDREHEPWRKLECVWEGVYSTDPTGPRGAPWPEPKDILAIGVRAGVRYVKLDVFTCPMKNARPDPGDVPTILT